MSRMDEQTLRAGREADPTSLRAFVAADLARAVELWAAAFGIELPDEEARRSARERLAFSLGTDPRGSFVAESDGALVGLAQALQRGRLWVLSSLAVVVEARGGGLGGALLERAFAYGAPGSSRLIVSSNDPSALALYTRMGLQLSPTVQAEGRIRGAAAGRASRWFREGGAGDVAGLEEISREVRGAPHTREILFALQRGDARLLLGEQAFSVVRPGHGVWLLAARDEDEAAALLVSSLALAGECERTSVRWVTEDQRWALEVFESAGMRVERYGALCFDGEPGALSPFIPSGAFA